MDIKDLPVKQIVDRTKFLLEKEEKNISPELKECVIQLTVCVEVLHKAVIDLSNKINKNSRNSHKPPSSDSSFGKRDKIKKGNKNGNGNSNTGSTLRKVNNPDEIVKHKLHGLCGCGATLDSIEVLGTKERQVFEIILQKKVIEHRAEYGECFCGKRHTAAFPAGVTNHTQYGPQAKAFVSYMSQYQLIPFERLKEMFKDIFKLSLCEGTVFNTNKFGYNSLFSFEGFLKEALLVQDVAHADETPIKVGTELHYLHTLSTSDFTYLHAFKGRGKAAIEEMSVLKNFKGTLVHDCFSMYFGYGKSHAICNAHLIRELRNAEEEHNLRWAHKIRRFLSDLNDLTSEEKLNLQDYELIKKEYKKLISRTFRKHPEYEVRRGERTGPGNLLWRLRKYQFEILRFCHEPDVPFTNNQAERDLRMAKVQQKISGHFRSALGSKIFARFRSFISTLKKRKVEVWDWMVKVFQPQNPSYIQLFT